MARNMASLVLSLLVSFTSLSLCEANYVPVLFLGSDKEHVPEDPTSAVHKLTDSEYQEDFLRPLLDKGPVVVFAQDTMSLEDFSMFGNAYGKRTNKNISPFANLEKCLEKMEYLLLPAVNMQPTTLSSADNPRWNVVDFKDPQMSLKESGIQLTANNLIVVHLPATKDASDRVKALQANDEIIGKFGKELDDAGVKYTLIYTALQPSWTADQEDISRISRNLLSVGEESIECVFNDSSNNTLLYTTLVTVMYFEKDKEPHTASFNCTEFSLESAHSAVEYKATLSKRSQDLTITFTFKEDRGYWYLVQIDLSSKVTNVTGDGSLIVSGIWAPRGFSYTCQDSPFYQNVSKPEDPKLGLRLTNFQVQPFANQTSKFGDPMDCVGFFTIPIWMSIFVTILLLAILGFGVQMVMSINTMDRFDDPKGKTIIVSNVD